MDSENNKLEHFTATILNDANQRSQKILEAVEKVRKVRLGNAEKEIRARNERYIEAEIAKVKSTTGRVVSQQMMDNKRRLFTKRGEVAKAIAADVRKKLEDWVKTEEYANWLKRELKRALDQLPEGDCQIAVTCRQQDLEMLERALFGSGRPFYVEASPEIELGGLRVECPQSHIAVDCTLDSSFEQTKEHIAEYIGLRLE